LIQICASEMLILGETQKAAHVLGLWLKNEEIPMPLLQNKEIVEIQEQPEDEKIKDPDFESAKNQERQSEI
jgi:hypothetical protein